jgi:hypothetical protein
MLRIAILDGNDAPVDRRDRRDQLGLAGRYFRIFTICADAAPIARSPSSRHREPGNDPT